MGGEDQQSTLLEDLETMHRSLKELESVKSYVQVIQHALSLRYACSCYRIDCCYLYVVSEAGTRQARDFSSHSSVSEYTELQAFVESVVKKCAIVEQNVSQHPLHLVAFLQELRDKTWSDIKTVLYESVIVPLTCCRAYVAFSGLSWMPPSSWSGPCMWIILQQRPSRGMRSRRTSVISSNFRHCSQLSQLPEDFDRLISQRRRTRCTEDWRNLSNTSSGTPDSSPI